MRLQLENPGRALPTGAGLGCREHHLGAHGSIPGPQPVWCLENPFSTVCESWIFPILKASCLGFQLTNVTSIYIL